MKRRFIVAADGMSKEAESSLVEFFREKRLGWWHRIPNFWLVTDRSETVTVNEIRDKIQKLRSDNARSCLVMQIYDDIDWAGLYPNSGAKRDEFDWLKSTWNGE
jgi:hypothetical protein